jgi:toxin ParE1/3/4
MPRIIRRERALDDLTEHWSYRALELGPDSADMLIERIEKRLLLLAEYPESGAKRDELRPGLRRVPIGKLVLFYNPLRDGIELVRVLDGRRDLQAIFAEEEDDEG